MRNIIAHDYGVLDHVIVWRGLKHECLRG
ncbi:HepT-like ribonuclease domain-containing protein [Cutibacterium namnetense]